MIHAGELLPDGRPRFRIVILEVARQNGKTEIVVILPAYWMFVDDAPMILGTSTKLEYARETWDKTRKLILRSTALQGLYDEKRWYVRGAGNTEMWSYAYDDRGNVIPDIEGPRYKIAAANEEGGRSLTINKGIADEFRQHHDWSAWDAMEPAASDWDSQIWATSNAGSDRSVVFNTLRQQALEYIMHGIGDPRVGLFSWSAGENAQDVEPDDPDAILQANPRIGYGGKTLDDYVAEARAAMRAGGERLTGFLTEKLCVRVRVLNPAIDPGSWLRCRAPGTLDSARNRIGACLDVAPDGGHVTFAVAGMVAEDKVRVEVAAAWDSIARARAELPGLLGRIKPKVFGWFPDGPGAAMAADLHLPPGYTPEAWKRLNQPIRGDMAACCMGLDDLARSRGLLHSGDMLIDQHVSECERIKRGSRWVFGSASGGHIDAAYAVAGAAHIARTLPPPVGRPRLVVATAD